MCAGGGAGQAPLRARNCPALPRLLDWPGMFEARFQSFDDPQPAQTGPRVTMLRAELGKRGLTGLILPRADRHQNEYVPPSEERLAWLTGFSGSAGITVVLAREAGVFLGGRHTPQTPAQGGTGGVYDLPPPPPPPGGRGAAKPPPGG